MRFGEPGALLLLAFTPLAVGFLWFGARRGRAAALRFSRRAARLVERSSPGRRRARDLLLLLALVLLAAAAARPQWGREEREVTLVGVDVLLALDTSFSMDARDVAPSRMERARYIASALTGRLAGNRVGMIAFSGDAFTQCPLTHDLGAVRTLLAGIATGAVESPGTNLSAMIEESVRAFEQQESRSRVVILLTDGQQDDLRLRPVAEVAAAAAEAGIVIHAIGVGTSSGATIPVSAEAGPTLMRDAAGSPIVSRLDATTLSELAALTGGGYWEVTSDDREIAAVADRIGRLEGGELGDRISDRYRERFQVPLALAAAALAAWGLSAPGARRREALA